MLTVVNFRDFGGLRTIHNTIVKHGMLFRSGTLEHLSRADLEALRTLGIRTVCDLRSVEEVRRHRDRVNLSDGFRVLHIPVTPQMNHLFNPWSRLRAMLSGKLRRLDVEALMRAGYRDFVTRFNEQFASLLRLLGDEANLPMLIHCTGGKDRTGFAAALILLMLEVPDPTVIDEYLRSNEFTGQFEALFTMIAPMMRLFGVKREQVRPLIEARREYLEIAMQTMRETFGSIEEYLRQGLGMTDASMSAARNILCN